MVGSGPKWEEVDRSGKKWAETKVLDYIFRREYLGVDAVRVGRGVGGRVGGALPELVPLVEVDHVHHLQHHVRARLEAERAATLHVRVCKALRRTVSQDLVPKRKVIGKIFIKLPYV